MALDGGEQHENASGCLGVTGRRSGVRSYGGGEMEQQGEGGAEGPTHGCMQCKARQRYMVEELRNRNTLWRCAVCNHVVNLIPGQYTADIVESGSDA